MNSSPQQLVRADEARTKSILGLHKGEQSLQNPSNKRNILADEKLCAVFKKDEVTMFVTELVNAHLK
jgi:chromatin remodeling complex protein RSC6